MSANCDRAVPQNQQTRRAHAHHRDRSAAAATFAKGTYFLDNPRIQKIRLTLKYDNKYDYCA